MLLQPFSSWGRPPKLIFCSLWNKSDSFCTSDPRVRSRRDPIAGCEIDGRLTVSCHEATGTAYAIGYMLRRSRNARWSGRRQSHPFVAPLDWPVDRLQALLDLLYWGPGRETLCSAQLAAVRPPLVVPGEPVQSGCSKASEDLLQAYLFESTIPAGQAARYRNKGDQE